MVEGSWPPCCCCSSFLESSDLTEMLEMESCVRKAAGAEGIPGAAVGAGGGLLRELTLLTGTVRRGMGVVLIIFKGKT